MKKICVYVFVVSIVLTFFSCKKDNNEVNVSKMADIQENAVNILSNHLSSGQNLSIAINNCIQQLTQNPEVESACLQDSDQIVINYRSGEVGVIYLFINDDVQDVEKRELKTKQISTEPFNYFSKENAGEPLITNHKVLIWEPFENDQFWNIDCYPLANDIKEKFDNCPDINFDVTVKKNNDCTVQSIRDLTNYGFVFIVTHGNCIKTADGETISYLFTRQEYSTHTINNEELKKRRQMLITRAEIIPKTLETHSTVRSIRTFWAITNKFFSKYVNGTFESPSIVYVTACKSYMNNILKDVFVNEKKASVYLGFTDNVSKRFGQEVAKKYVDKMLSNRLSAYDAYIRLDNRHDPYKPKKAWLHGYFKESPTYFASEANTVTCENLGISMPLNCNYSTWDLWCQGISHSAADFIYAVNIHFRTSQCNNPFHAGDYHTAYAYTFDEFVNFDAFDTLGIRVFANGIVESQACSYVQYEDRENGYHLNEKRIVNCAMHADKISNNNYTLSFWFDDEDGNRWHGAYSGSLHNKK